MNNSETRRVFLALWPDAQTREQIGHVQQQLAALEDFRSAVAVRQQNLHMTLHFIGGLTRDVLPGLSDSLATVDSPVFAMKISQVGCFAKARVLWLGLERTPAELIALERQTGECVKQCVENYQQKAFNPHISLFRKARCKHQALACETITWRAENFVLVESKTWAEGVEYRVLQEWPLRQ